MKCFVYILENSRQKHYVGITKLDVLDKLERHNKGDVYSTKFDKPWKLIYVEEYNSYQTARSREKKIKSWHNGDAFKKLIGITGSSNGRTWDSESHYLGSNPSPVAIKFGGVK